MRHPLCLPLQTRFLDGDTPSPGSYLRHIASALPTTRAVSRGWTYAWLVGQRAHPAVDEYIARLPAWQRDLCTELREIIWQADPDIEETIKRTVQPYFILDGNVCALLATKDHVNLFLYDPTVPDPDGIINQGRGNKTASPSRSTAVIRSTIRLSSRSSVPS